ncbi:MAG: TRL-like family protein [Rickettsiales bacterium]|jgi:hypothetical protein|nr:TRL-like family protein [Rickettsiales bacterium]
MKNIFLVAAMAGILGGCMNAVSPVGTGVIFSSVKGTYGGVTTAVATKTGRSCATNILGWFAIGDASVESAKRDGSITTVSAVDYQTTTVLGFFASSCTIVSGN